MINGTRKIYRSAEFAVALRSSSLHRLASMYCQSISHRGNINILRSKVLRVEADLEVNLNIRASITILKQTAIIFSFHLGEILNEKV